eukprot:CFRG1679T1
MRDSVRVPITACAGTLFPHSNFSNRPVFLSTIGIASHVQGGLLDSSFTYRGLHRKLENNPKPPIVSAMFIHKTVIANLTQHANQRTEDVRERV